MIKLLPGTTVKADISQENIADSIFTPMFLTGGLVLSQVAQLTGLEPHTIQNWVKRGFLAPPEKILSQAIFAYSHNKHAKKHITNG